MGLSAGPRVVKGKNGAAAVEVLWQCVNGAATDCGAIIPCNSSATLGLAPAVVTVRSAAAAAKHQYSNSASQHSIGAASVQQKYNRNVDVVQQQFSNTCNRTTAAVQLLCTGGAAARQLVRRRRR